MLILPPLVSTRQTGLRSVLKDRRYIRRAKEKKTSKLFHYEKQYCRIKSKALNYEKMFLFFVVLLFTIRLRFGNKLSITSLRVRSTDILSKKILRRNYFILIPSKSYVTQHKINSFFIAIQEVTNKQQELICVLHELL